MLKVENIIVEVRDITRNRLGQIAQQDIQNLEVVIQHNNVGTWTLEIMATHPLASVLSTPGSGIVISTDAGTIISGNTLSSSFDISAENPEGIITYTGVDDNQYLLDYIVFPDPLHNINAQTKDKDTRSGSAEKIMKEFVSYNMGPLALTSRKIANLLIETNLDRGAITSKTAKNITVGQCLAEIASVTEMGFKIVQEADNLVFKVYEPTDRSEDIVWKVANNNIDDAKFEYNAPSGTVAIVAGTGTGVNRVYKEYTNAQASTAQTQWGRRIELFIDSKESDTNDELTQAGAEALKDAVITSNTEVTPSEATLAYMTDWNIGDIVKVEVNADVTLTAIIDTVAIVLDSEGITVKATVNKSNRNDPISTRLSNLEATSENFAVRRYTQTVTTPTLTAGQEIKTSVVLNSGYRLLKVSTNNKACRIRLYADTDGQDLDLSRLPYMYPEDIGLMLDLVLPDDNSYNMLMSPLIDGYTIDGTNTVPMTIKNEETSSTTITLTFIYIKTE